MSRRVTSWVFGFSVLTLTGCQLVWGFEDFSQGEGEGLGTAGATAIEGGAAGTSGTAASGTSATDAGASGSPGVEPCDTRDAPSGMVPVELADDECIWIDTHEVTQGDYQELVDELVSSEDPTPFTDVPCQWKTAFAPACATDPQGDETDPALPVTCVDWCDARAYCRFRGKTLCGAPGLPESWWETACTSGGPQHDYPYGPSYEAQACNGRDNIGHGCHPSCSLSPSGALVGCSTPSGILDLSGNVSEWVDECSGYSNDGETCAIRGGNASQDASALQCASRQSPPRSTRGPFIGFRCCWRRF